MLTKLISSISQNSIKSILKLDDRINEISKKFENGCPSKSELEKIITQKNTLITTLTTTKQLLNGVTKTGQTVDGLLTGLKVAVNTIKYLPIPIAPFTPLTVTNVLADSLDTLGGIVKNNKGIIKMIPQIFKSITPEIDKVIQKLNSLDIALNACIKSQNLTQKELSEILTIDPTSKTPSNSSSEDLLSQLSPGSNNPILHKGFKLEIQYDPKNKFSFSSRRIKASNPSKSNIILYNLPNNEYSFSSSVEVLINEVKFRIDNYLLDN